MPLINDVTLVSSNTMIQWVHISCNYLQFNGRFHANLNFKSKRVSVPKHDAHLGWELLSQCTAFHFIPSGYLSNITIIFNRCLRSWALDQSRQPPTYHPPHWLWSSLPHGGIFIKKRRNSMKPFCTSSDESDSPLIESTMGKRIYSYPMIWIMHQKFIDIYVKLVVWTS